MAISITKFIFIVITRSIPAKNCKQTTETAIVQEILHWLEPKIHLLRFVED